MKEVQPLPLPPISTIRETYGEVRIRNSRLQQKVAMEYFNSDGRICGYATEWRDVPSIIEKEQP